MPFLELKGDPLPHDSHCIHGVYPSIALRAKQVAMNKFDHFLCPIGIFTPAIIESPFATTRKSVISP